MPERAFSSSSRTRIRYGIFIGLAGRETRPTELHGKAGNAPRWGFFCLKSRSAAGWTRCATAPFVSSRTGLQSVDDRLVGRRSGEDAADLAIEQGLLGSERPGHRRSHRDLDGD